MDHRDGLGNRKVTSEAPRARELHLTASGGLGLAPRAAASAERARKAIRTAVRHIGEHDPDLGEHLSKAVRTATLCTHAPGARDSLDSHRRAFPHLSPSSVDSGNAVLRHVPSRS